MFGGRWSATTRNVNRSALIFRVCDGMTFPHTLSLIETDGKHSLGAHTIKYDCHFVLRDGGRVRTSVTSTHAFQVKKGCDLHMLIGDDAELSAREELAKYLLLSSDEFNRAMCNESEVYNAKERVFRSFDTHPVDGVLSLYEMEQMALKQSVSPYIIRHWNAVYRSAHDADLELPPSSTWSTRTRSPNVVPTNR